MSKLLRTHVQTGFLGVAFQYKVNRETELLNQIRELKNSRKKGLDNATILKIKELTEKLEEISLSKITTYPPRGCEKYLDWQRISDKFLRRK